MKRSSAARFTWLQRGPTSPRNPRSSQGHFPYSQIQCHPIRRPKFLAAVPKFPIPSPARYWNPASITPARKKVSHCNQVSLIAVQTANSQKITQRAVKLAKLATQQAEIRPNRHKKSVSMRDPVRETPQRLLPAWIRENPDRIPSVHPTTSSKVVFAQP